LVGVLILADWNRHRLLAECLRRVDLARTRSVPSRRSDVHTRSSIPV
jgi:hypothetical protein